MAYFNFIETLWGRPDFNRDHPGKIIGYSIIEWPILILLKLDGVVPISIGIIPTK
jgi:hypothetical protein